ncbi:MAG: hypothetical protein R3B90_18565 [Planctomycetaceae bacterium]
MPFELSLQLQNFVLLVSLANFEVGGGNGQLLASEFRAGHVRFKRVDLLVESRPLGLDLRLFRFEPLAVNLRLRDGALEQLTGFDGPLQLDGGEVAGLLGRLNRQFIQRFSIGDLLAKPKLFELLPGLFERLLGDFDGELVSRQPLGGEGVNRRTLLGEPGLLVVELADEVARLTMSPSSTTKSRSTPAARRGCPLPRRS